MSVYQSYARMTSQSNALFIHSLLAWEVFMSEGDEKVMTIIFLPWEKQHFHILMKNK